jgi:hypothetical protein
MRVLLKEDAMEVMKNDIARASGRTRMTMIIFEGMPKMPRKLKKRLKKEAKQISGI